MDNARRPPRFQTDEEWTTWRTAYQKAYRLANKERRKLVSAGLLPKRRRDHEKRRS
jgi:hypothetical protein